MKKIIFIIGIIFNLHLFGKNIDGIIIYNSFETNSTYTNLNQTKKENTFIFLNPLYNTKTLKDSFKTLKPKLNIAIVVNKKILKKYLPSLINSINAYFLTKNISYSLKVFDKNSIEKAAKNYKNVIVYSIDINKTLINEYNNTKFYFPVINKNDVNFSADNVYFGGINYKQQINKLSSFVTDNKAIAITSNAFISKQLLKKEKEKISIKEIKFPYINYNELANKFIFFNISARKTAWILSTLSNHINITTKLQLSPQIDFDPLLISLTQPQDVQKLIIANSILNVPVTLEDYNRILNSGIKYNWLNYSTNILLNKIYNLSTKTDKFYMNDFDTYIFNHQIEYKTKIYKIINNSFREIY